MREVGCGERGVGGLRYTLNDVCFLITDGSHFSPANEEVGYPMLSVKDMDETDFNLNNCKHIGEEAFSVLATNGCVPKLNDVVVAKDGSYLKTAFPIKEERKIALLSSIAILRPNTKLVYPTYLSYYLKSDSVYRMVSLNYISGTALKRIILKGIKKIPINLPDLGEQKRRAALLDQIYDIIQKRKEQLSALDDLIKARFVEMFGEPDTNPMRWPEKLLSEMLNVLGGYAFKSDGFSETNGIPVLRIGNINAGLYKPVNMVFWEEDERLERYIMHPGDLVMSLTGTVGKDDYGNVCILGSDYSKYYLNQRNAKLELKEGLEKHYLSQLLRFDKIKKRLTGISRGVRQANISNKDILSLRVPIPPLELQQQFAAFVAQIDKSKAAIQKSLDETQLLFDSLMQQYFG